MTQVAQPANTRLSIRDGQVEFDQAQLDTLNTALRVRHATPADYAVFFHQCRRTGLDPFAKQIYLIARQEWDKEARAKVWRQTIQTGIDGFRLVARRAADARREVITYDDPVWFDKEGKQYEIWTSTEPPAAAKAVVHRGAGRFPFVAMFDEYVPLKDEYAPDTVDDKGKKVKGVATGRKVPSGMWGTRPAGQLYKCAEAGALRMACPQDLSGVYILEEMEREDPNIIDVQPIDVEEGQEPLPQHRDWFAELELCETGDAVNALWAACRDAGEKTTRFDREARKKGAALKAAAEGTKAEQTDAAVAESVEVPSETRGECILTGEEDENPDDCTTHDHVVPDPAEE